MVFRVDGPVKQRFHMRSHGGNLDKTVPIIHTRATNMSRPKSVAAVRALLLFPMTTTQPVEPNTTARISGGVLPIALPFNASETLRKHTQMNISRSANPERASPSGFPLPSSTDGDSTAVQAEPSPNSAPQFTHDEAPGVFRGVEQFGQNMSHLTSELASDGGRRAQNARKCPGIRVE